MKLVDHNFNNATAEIVYKLDGNTYRTTFVNPLLEECKNTKPESKFSKVIDFLVFWKN